LPPVLALALAACGTPAPTLPPGPLDVRIDVVERSWHTDFCVAPNDISGRLTTLAADFRGATFLCFGFGERHYMMDHDHGVGTMLASLAPSEAVVLVIPLQVQPAEAVGAASGQATVVTLHVSRAGAANLADFVWRSIRTGADGRPEQLRGGVNAGSMFYAASSDYDAFATCNTWSASGLRAAGLPVNDAVIFADDLMAQVRRAAAAQSTAR
jgi:uncharacterized protein (TIGR02117 family)